MATGWERFARAGYRCGFKWIYNIYIYNLYIHFISIYVLSLLLPPAVITAKVSRPAWQLRWGMQQGLPCTCRAPTLIMVELCGALNQH